MRNGHGSDFSLVVSIEKLRHGLPPCFSRSTVLMFFCSLTILVRRTGKASLFFLYRRHDKLNGESILQLIQTYQVFDDNYLSPLATIRNPHH
jgi:hypothetical protein